MEELEKRVAKLEEELPPLKCIKMLHQMSKIRDGWCKQSKTVEDIKEFAELCKPLVDYLQKNHGVASLIVVSPEYATLYDGEIQNAYDWDYVEP